MLTNYRWIMKGAMLASVYQRSWRRHYRQQGKLDLYREARTFGFSKDTRTGDITSIIREVLRKKAGAMDGIIVAGADLETHFDNIAHKEFEEAFVHSKLDIASRTAWIKNISANQIIFGLPGANSPPPVQMEHGGVQGDVLTPDGSNTVLTHVLKEDFNKWELLGIQRIHRT